MSRPSSAQHAALNAARAWGYVRPASPTHARKLETSSVALTKTVKVCVREGWLRHDARGRHVLTEAGEAFFASTVGW